MSVLYAGVSEVSPILDTSNLQKTFNILEYRQSDHILNDIRWLRANTNSWHDGEMYEAAYLALTEYQANGTLKTHTINNTSVQYYLAENGFKIALQSQVENVDNLYNSQGFADYFILDADNKRFKLPRKSNRRIIKAQKPTEGNDYLWYNLYSDGWVEQGGKFSTMNTLGLVISLPIEMSSNIYSIIGTGNEYTNTSGHFTPKSATTTTFTADIGTDGGNGGWWQVSGYAAESEYADLNDVLYDYYYVGEFAQTALLQTAGIASEKLNLIDQTIEDLKNASSGGAVDITREFFEIAYPVGSLYIGTQNVCPMSAIIKDSVWELVTATGALWLGDGTNGGTTIEAGLPNITGTFGSNGTWATSDNKLFTRASAGSESHGWDGSSSTRTQFTMDASKYNSIYGNSDTVQPPAYVVNVWRRVS